MLKTKKSIIKEYSKHEKDTGSSDVQIALLTGRISRLTEHFRLYPKDHSSRRGLLKIVGRRHSLLRYLKRKDLESYKKTTASLGIRT